MLASCETECFTYKQVAVIQGVNYRNKFHQMFKNSNSDLSVLKVIKSK